MYPPVARETVKRRKALAPVSDAAFEDFGRAVFGNGALDVRTKQLLAVAVAHAMQCPYRIRAHAKAARRAGASDSEIMEAVWVAAEVAAGAAMSHAALAFDELDAEADRADATSGAT